MNIRNKTIGLLFLLLFVSAGNAYGGGVVSSASPEATKAGVEILNAGGNAIDAAVAVSFALGVTEPAGSGIGGQTFLLVHPPYKKPFVIHGTSYAPIKLPVKVTPADLIGRRASTVPSTVRVLDFAWRKYGSGRVSWKQLLAPAIRYADTGYPLGHFRFRSLVRSSRNLLAHPRTAAMYLGNGKKLPELGQRMKQPILAKCLRRLAEAGADDFYKGQIARDIVADMKAHGGWITLDDLQSFPQPKIVKPLADRYRGFQVYSLPPPTGGWVVLLSLNILEHAPKGALNVENGDARMIWLAETLRVAHANRADSPITNFKEYAKQVAEKINNAAVERLLKTMKLPKRKESGGETTHFSIVDGDGMAVAGTASINAYYGCCVAHPKWGFLYNDYMHEFELDQPLHPYQLRTGGMPYSSMSGTIVAKDGMPVMAIGSPGSKRIISAVVQVISHWVDVKRGIKAAVACPRIHVIPEDDLHIELTQKQISLPLLLKLEQRGYDVVRPISSLFKGDLTPFFGGVHAVAFEGKSWVGAADPRRDGTVGRSAAK